MTGNRSAPSLSPQTLDKFRALIVQRIGVHPQQHQTATLSETIRDVLEESNRTTPEELYADLVAGRREDLLEAIAARITIGETHFFRVAPQIRALRELILPDLVGRRAARKRLEIWSAGCSTGEEPYTLAILVRQTLPARGDWTIRLLATDISRPALDAARRAHYRRWSFRGTPEDVQERYFTREGHSWELHPSIREMVTCKHLNLVSDPYPEPEGGFDLIVCRNVTIYFDRAVTQDIYSRFVRALAPDGWLVLGPSDPPPDPALSLETVYADGAVLWRKGGERQNKPARHIPHPAATVTAPRPPPSGQRTRTQPAAPAPPLIEDAWERLQAGDRTGARERARAVLQRSPLAAEAHLLMGMLDLEEGLVAQALDHLRRATFLDPDNALAQYTLARAHVQAGNRRRALTALRHAEGILEAWEQSSESADHGGVAATELRYAVEAQIESLQREAR